MKLQKEEFKKERIKNILLSFTTIFMFVALVFAGFFAYNANKKEKEVKSALIKMQIAQDKEALQRFNDLEKRVIVIKTAKADPEILLNKMRKIAKNHKDSINLFKRINTISK